MDGLLPGEGPALLARRLRDGDGVLLAALFAGDGLLLRTEASPARLLVRGRRLPALPGVALVTDLVGEALRVADGCGGGLPSSVPRWCDHCAISALRTKTTSEGTETCPEGDTSSSTSRRCQRREMSSWLSGGASGCRDAKKPRQPPNSSRSSEPRRWASNCDHSSVRLRLVRRWPSVSEPKRAASDETRRSCSPIRRPSDAPK